MNHLLNWMEIGNLLPTYPKEESGFTAPEKLNGAAISNGCPQISDFTLSRFPSYADVKCAFAFNMLYSGPVDAPIFVADYIAKHLQLFTAECDSALRQQNVSFEALGARTGVRVTIAPSSYSGHPSITIRRITLAGQTIVTPRLPATVRVTDINNDPAGKGRLWESASAGHAAGLHEAISDGCSIEEVDEVCLRTH